MSELFKYQNTFNDDIGNWDTNSVTDMNKIFYDANAFNEDISLWKTSSATRMDYMFLATPMVSNTAFHPS